MVTLFPSILPNADTYTRNELTEWNWANELRPIAAELETDEINGRSTQLQVIDYLSGRFNKETLDMMREEIKTDNPDFRQIAKQVESLDAYSNDG